MQRSRALVTALLLLAATGIALPLVLGFLNRLHPAFDSFAHFRAHLAFGLLLVSLILLALPQRLVAGVAFAFAASALATTGVVSVPWQAQASTSLRNSNGAPPTYRLLQLNLRWDNRAPERFLSLIGELEPDVITLNEASDGWLPKLQLLNAAYPHSVICTARSHIGGVAILSRRPFAAGPQCSADGSMTVAKVDFGGSVIDVAAIHLGWPWPKGQRHDIDVLEPMLRALGASALLAGDFNAATWSASVTRVEDAGKLRRVWAIGPTWLDRRMPAVLRPWIGLPIDQVMAKGGVILHSVVRGGSAGSDHLPIVVDFSILREEQPPVVTVVDAGLSAAGRRF